MDGKKEVLGLRSQEFYSKPHHTKADRMIYRSQFHAYVKEVHDITTDVESIQALDLDD